MASCRADFGTTAAAAWSREGDFADCEACAGAAAAEAEESVEAAPSARAVSADKKVVIMLPRAPLYSCIRATSSSGCSRAARSKISVCACACRMRICLALSASRTVDGRGRRVAPRGECGIPLWPPSWLEDLQWVCSWTFETLPMPPPESRLALASRRPWASSRTLEKTPKRAESHRPSRPPRPTPPKPNRLVARAPLGSTPTNACRSLTVPAPTYHPAAPRRPPTRAPRPPLPPQRACKTTACWPAGACVSPRPAGRRRGRVCPRRMDGWI